MGAIDIVTEQMLARNMLPLNLAARSMASSLADNETREVASVLWKCVVQRSIRDAVEHELEQRRLLPVTVHTLSALLCEAISMYKTSAQ